MYIYICIYKITCTILLDCNWILLKNLCNLFLSQDSLLESLLSLPKVASSRFIVDIRLHDIVHDAQRQALNTDEQKLLMKNFEEEEWTDPPLPTKPSLSSPPVNVFDGEKKNNPVEVCSGADALNYHQVARDGEGGGGGKTYLENFPDFDLFSSPQKRQRKKSTESSGNESLSDTTDVVDVNSGND